MMIDYSGQQIGNYRLIRCLGSGGFASVYLGQHVRIATQQAAIKLLHISDVDTKKFEQEAETTAALVHPHIIRLFDFDVHDRMPFLVIDYAPGGSLRSRHLEGTQVPLPTVVQYVQEIAKALEYAHGKNVIHRDIKPDNILIGGQGELRLSDFGIAVLSQTGRTTLAASSGIGGTAYYMAPEQSRGKPEKASDQYALGIMVYEWLCGKPPFTEGNAINIQYQHAYEPIPPLGEQLPTLPPAIEQVIMRALAKDPYQRFATVQAFATALEHASQLKQSVPISTRLDATPSVPPPPPPPMLGITESDARAKSQPPIVRPSAPRPTPQIGSSTRNDDPDPLGHYRTPDLSYGGYAPPPQLSNLYSDRHYHTPYSGYAPPPQSSGPYSDQQYRQTDAYQQYGQSSYDHPYGQPSYGQQQSYNQSGYQQPYVPQPNPYGAPQASGSTMDMKPNTAAGLSYIAGWLSGVIVLSLEKRNRFVRFHAMQSILFSLTFIVFWFIIGAFSAALPSGALGCIISLVVLGVFARWVKLLVDAFQGKYVKLPVIGNYAERYANRTAYAGRAR